MPQWNNFDYIHIWTYAFSLFRIFLLPQSKRKQEKIIRLLRCVSSVRKSGILWKKVLLIFTPFSSWDQFHQHFMSSFCACRFTLISIVFGIYVRDYLSGIHEIQDTNASYSIDPLQTWKWVCKITMKPFYPLLTEIQS